MEGEKDTRGYERYVALDIHKEYVLAGGQTARQAWVMLPRRISMAKFGEWATTNLHEGDAVVIETSTNVWDIYDIVAPLVTRTAVAHAGAVRQIAEARVKTDKEDVKRLIRLLTRSYRVQTANLTYSPMLLSQMEMVRSRRLSLSTNSLG